MEVLPICSCPVTKNFDSVWKCASLSEAVIAVFYGELVQRWLGQNRLESGMHSWRVIGTGEGKECVPSRVPVPSESKLLVTFC